jgi:hypothetical protein
VRTIAALFFAYYLFSIDNTNNVVTAYLDIISQKSYLYGKQWQERIHYFQTEPSDTCVIQPLTTVPKTIFYTDFTPEAELHPVDYSFNSIVAKYYNKIRIICYGKPPEAETNYETILLLGKKAKQHNAF